MDHLLAKTKGRNGTFYKVLSNQNIYELPEDLGNSVEYNSDYKLEDDEWFAIPEFSEKEYCLELLKERFVSAEYNQLTRDDFSKMEYLCAVQTGNYYFQKVTSSLFIRKKYFSLSEEPELKDNEPIFVINPIPDAIYVKENDMLYFKRLNSITSIFKGIYEIYKEATQEETESFLNNDFIELVDEYSADNVKSSNRKRIAMARETLEKFTPDEKRDIFRYIRDYCHDLEFDEGKECFAISKEDELKRLIYGIEQRYYTTKHGNERRVANSILPI